MTDRDDNVPAVPAVTSVRFPWSENRAVPRGPFTSLWEADRALSIAVRVWPAPNIGYDKTDFVVTWDDGKTHEGRIDLTAKLVETGNAAGGILRAHLARYAEYLLSTSYGGVQQRWGHELLRRLAADLATITGEPGTRNASSSAPYAGHGVPTLEPWRSGAKWLRFLPSPATLRPDPTAIDRAIGAALDRQAAERRLDFSAPEINALVNWVTDALRADLPSLDLGDAAVIWMKWAAVVRDFRQRRDGRTLRNRLTTVLWNVFTAIHKPAELWRDFCPWRTAFFDRDRLEPGTIGHNPKRSPLEIDPWQI